MTQPSISARFSYRADPQVPAFADDHPILVFDGKCVLCSGFVQFVLRRDRRARFRFVSAQSALGSALYRHYGLDATHYESNLLLADGQLHMKSSGSLRIFGMLGFPFSLLAIGWAMPRPVRDWLYDVVASHRLQWFGSRDQCMLPDPRFADRFLG
jgi:predicted DCC family thiol-disulfide oxidoreductase YuxK